MADETLTLALHGDVSLDAFAVAISHWRGLVDQLTRETARDQRVSWVIEDLSAGSATATIRAVTEDPATADAIVREYVAVGEAMSRGTPRVLTQPIRDEAVALSGLIGDGIEYIRFETPQQDLLITRNYDTLLEQVLAEYENGLAAPPQLPASYGGVQGRIQTLTSRGPLRFTLYDTLFDRAVNCYLREGQEEIMRDAWGETATVEGIVTRDPDSGRPLNVRHVWNVTAVRHVERGAYTRARGAVVPGPADRRTTEELISAARDA